MKEFVIILILFALIFLVVFTSSPKEERREFVQEIKHEIEYLWNDDTVSRDTVYTEKEDTNETNH